MILTGSGVKTGSTGGGLFLRVREVDSDLSCRDCEWPLASGDAGRAASTDEWCLRVNDEDRSFVLEGDIDLAVVKDGDCDLRKEGDCENLERERDGGRTGGGRKDSSALSSVDSTSPSRSAIGKVGNSGKSSS